MKMKQLRRIQQAQELARQRADAVRADERAMVREASGANSPYQRHMSMRVEKVTPDLAAIWIEKNYHSNRSLRWTDVERYAAMMKAGQWRLTHQGVAFDTNGALIDGQHRLWAIIESGVTVELTVALDVPHTAFGALDQNRVRTVADLAEQEWITTRVTAMAKCMARGPVQSIESSTINDRSPDELIRFCEEHEPILRQTMSLIPANRTAKGRRFLTAPVLGAICRAAYHVDRDTIARFMGTFMSGVAGGREDVGCILLRDWLASDASKGASAGEVYQKAQRAIKAFVMRDPITKLYAVDDDLFPLPTKGRQRGTEGTIAKRDRDGLRRQKKRGIA